MNCIGNDIVALGAVDAQRTVGKRFYTKILTDEEYSLYQPALLPFHCYIWLLWSIKEAAYKYHKQRMPGLTFAPLQISVTDVVIPVLVTRCKNVSIGSGFTVDDISATVSFAGISADVHSFISPHYITSFVCAPGTDHVYWGIRYIDDTAPEHQSAMVRAYASDHLRKVYPNQNIAVKTNTSGIPVILIDDTVRAVSFSHHANYVSYVFY